MPGAFRSSAFRGYFCPLVLLLSLVACSASRPPQMTKPVPAAALVTVPPTPASSTAPIVRPERNLPLLLGIDVLEADNFAVLKGKRVGLLSHPAGVNRLGVRTVDVLRRAPGVKLVALYSVEHGINMEFTAGKPYNDYKDSRTGLPVFSLYKGDGHMNKAQPYQLKGIDVMVIDLQDNGTRSYTFISALHSALEACFANKVEVVVLDRPNPLGGLKVDGPMLDKALMSYVGAFRVPYVHGLTMGELARMAKDAPGVLDISDAVRERGKLVVVPMRGWRRSMRWTETGLTWVPTSPHMQEFPMVMGYPMTGLGCILGGFSHGVGEQYEFRGISHATASMDVVEKELRALKLPGLQFRRVSVPNAHTGKPALGIYIEVIDWDDWEPTELSFYMMKLACKLEPKNPFATATQDQRRTFLIHMGSQAFYNDLVAKGAKIDIDAWLRQWREQDKIYQQQSRRYWLYN